MVPAGRLSGALKHENGTPVVGVEISADAPIDKYGRTVTRRDGSFTFDNLPPGSYYVGPMPRDYNMLTKCLRGVEVKAGETTSVGTLTKADGIIVTGKVIDKDTGQPVPHVGVAIKPRYYAITHGGSSCDENGCFTARLIPGETYTISSRALYSDRAQVEITIPKRARSFSMILPLEKQITGKGLVLDSAGKPLRGARVEVPSLLRLCAQYGASMGTTQTDANGRFEVGLLSRRDISNAPSHLTVTVQNQQGSILAQQDVRWRDMINGRVVLRL